MSAAAAAAAAAVVVACAHCHETFSSHHDLVLHEEGPCWGGDYREEGSDDSEDSREDGGDSPHQHKLSDTHRLDHSH